MEEVEVDLSVTPRKIPYQNVVMRLIRRETHTCAPAAQFHVARAFHQNVFPNFTVVNVEKPPCFLRKFSPDGQHFVAFSSDQTSIEIYEYRGPASAEDLLGEARGEYTANSNDQESLNIRNRIFERFFRLRYVVSVASNGEQLNRECSLFTDNGRYVIVGSAATLEEAHAFFFDRYRNNESVSPNQRLEDYSLHIVDLYSGALCDTRAFKVDKIFLSHNQGLYLYRNTLAVLSVQHQTIHIFQVTADGSFVDMRAIGRLCYDDDEFVLSYGILHGQYNHHHQNHYQHQPGGGGGPGPGGGGGGGGGGAATFRPFRETTINSLKHRLLVFLYRRAVLEGERENEERSPLRIRKFYQHFDQFLQLRMWKMQLLDENHLLIKYASEEVVTLTADPSSQPAFFVIYNMQTTQKQLLKEIQSLFEITFNVMKDEREFIFLKLKSVIRRFIKVLAVFENTSEELLELFENFCDLFRNATLHLETHFPCSPSSNIYARLIQQRFKQTIINAKFGGHTEAVKRLLTQLPISSQSYSSSPYLDLSLFSYDDKWVSLMERPKTCGDHPIRFYTRDSGLLKFKIHAGVLGRNPPPTARRLVAFTFHPYDPFAISVQRTNSEYVVNFHIRHNVS